jgi:hypothetical protein
VLSKHYLAKAGITDAETGSDVNAKLCASQGWTAFAEISLDRPLGDDDLVGDLPHTIGMTVEELINGSPEHRSYIG